MHYDLVTPVDNIFNNIEDLLEYRDMETVPIHAIRKYPIHTTFLTRPENSESPSRPGIISLQSRNCGLLSRHIFARPVYNSSRP